jgi:RNA polymerase sigma-70 factor (ECF subfamily)
MRDDGAVRATPVGSARPAQPVGPPHARDEALTAVRARLHAFIVRRVESADVADDLTQEVLLRLLLHADGHVEDPTPWLYRVARNVIIDHYRTRARSRLSQPASGDPPEAALVEDPFADDPRAAERELAGCLRSLVDQLAEPYRSAVTAADLQGLTQAGVARAAGVSVSGMKSRVQRGRRQLRDLLTECCRVQTGPTGSISDYEPGSGCGDAPPGAGSGGTCRVDAGAQDPRHAPRGARPGCSGSSSVPVAGRMRERSSSAV